MCQHRCTWDLENERVGWYYPYSWIWTLQISDFLWFYSTSDIWIVRWGSPIWGICWTVSRVRISLSICCVTLEKSDRADRIQSLTWGACGRVTKGHKPISSPWAFALIDYLSYIVPLCCLAQAFFGCSSSPWSLSESAQGWTFEGRTEVKVCEARLPRTKSLLTSPYLVFVRCEVGPTQKVYML